MDETEALAALGALGQETRLRLYRLLVASGPAGLSAGNIAERLGVIPSSLSFHLQHLVQAGLISQHRTGRLMIYAAVPDAMAALIGYLTDNCRGQPAVAAHRFA
ncbi:MAG TPA: metalloregulator ArsR/SmtB family transcription factor [Stellaceae bacterium]|nr:metalloregulator ArsR/SmtB family transcription factor [Stellaceae bacterium]